MKLFKKRLCKLFLFFAFLCRGFSLYDSGTVITEWNEGKINLQKVLESKESIDQFVDNLVGIAKAYGFEGWLINIECEVEVFYLFIFQGAFF